MAVVTESFSIREYTERMRSIDLRRCWPFDAGSEATPPLPSILVRRFNWWADELDAARSALVVKEELGQSKEEAAAAIWEADDIPPQTQTPVELSAALPAGEETRRAEKGKQRTPKKRSIVELFAAAPLIAGAVYDVEADSDDEGDCQEEGGVVEEEEMDVVIRKRNGVKENNIKRRKKRKKQKNKKKGIKEGFNVEICAWEKEKVCKPKMISTVQSCMFQNPHCRKKSTKTARSFVESQKKPTKTKAVQRKHKVLQTSIRLSRNQEVAKKLPVRSILKNQKRGTTDRKSSKLVSTKAANLIKFYCESNRHVTFSVKDDILGNNKACSSMDFPQLQNLCKIFSDVLAASSAMNHSSKGHDLTDATDRPQEVNACEKGTHAGVIDRIEASSTEKNQSSDSNGNLCQPTIVNSSNSSCSGTEKASFAVMVDLNHSIEANDIDCFIPPTSTLSTSCIYSGDLTSRGTFHEQNPNSTEIHLEAGLPRASEPSVVPAPHDKFVASSDVTSSVTLLKNPISHSSTPCLIVYDKTNEMQCQPQVDADVKYCRQIEEHQSGSHRSPNCQLGSICYSMGSKKSGESLFIPDSVPTCRSKCPGEDLIGLPINLQGELISKFHSGTKFCEAYNKQNMELGSRHNFSANRHVESNGRMKKKFVGAASYQKHRSDWSRKHYSTRERVRHWLKFSEFEDSEKLELQKKETVKDKDRFIHCNSNPRSHSFREFRNGDVTHNFCNKVDLQGKCNVDYHTQHTVQPTMRLMGKNVAVGGISRDCNGFNDRKTWNNNENVAEQTQFATFPEKPLSQQWMRRECVSHATIGRSKGNLFGFSDSIPNSYHMKTLEPTFDYVNFPQQPQWQSRNPDSAVVNHTFEVDINKQALPPQALLNKASQFLGNCISGEGSVSMGHHYPAVVASHPHNVHQHMLLSSAHCKHSQNVSRVSLSTTQPQIKCQDFGNISQIPLVQPTAKLPQWMLHAEQQKRNQLSDSRYSDPTAVSQPCDVSGTSSNSHLSPYHKPLIPFSVHKAGTHKSCGPLFVSNACPPSIPLATAIKSNGDVKKNIIVKKKEWDGIYSNFACFKSPGDAQKLIKRPASFDDGIMNPAGKRTLKGQIDPLVPAEPNGTVYEYPLPDKAVSLNSSSSRFDRESRSGPTKLVAGAKHILKPCQRMDEGNCRPIHSTIIFPSAAASGKLFGPEKKIANIYEF